MSILAVALLEINRFYCSLDLLNVFEDNRILPPKDLRYCNISLMNHLINSLILLCLFLLKHI